jgi:hypothetical protein
MWMRASVGYAMPQSAAKILNSMLSAFNVPPIKNIGGPRSLRERHRAARPARRMRPGQFGLNRTTITRSAALIRPRALLWAEHMARHEPYSIRAARCIVDVFKNGHPRSRSSCSARLWWYLEQFCGIQGELAIKKLYEPEEEYSELLTYFRERDFEISALFPDNARHFPTLVEVTAQGQSRDCCRRRAIAESSAATEYYGSWQLAFYFSSSMRNQSIMNCVEHGPASEATSLAFKGKS